MKFLVRLNLFIWLTTLFMAHNAAQDCESGMLTSTTGDWAEEMSWELYLSGNEVATASFQGTQNYASTELSVCLEPGCYYFILSDSWGDGWNGGQVEIEMDNGLSMVIEMEDGVLAYTTFEIGETVDCDYALFGCTNPNAENYVEGATMDDGSCLFPETFLTSGGDERSYYLHLPQNLAPNAPLVFVLHGYYGDASSIAAFAGMSEIADQEGFVVCYPQGLPDFQGANHWNANLGISAVNDVQFLTELALHLQTAFDLNTECTYSCGFSNGGYMSYTLACASPDVFKAIGSVGGTMSGADWETCEVQAVPVVHIHGTNDNDVYYTSTLGSNNPWEGAPGVEAVVAHWANVNGCSEVTTTSLPDVNPSDGSTVDLIAHSGSPTGYQAQVYRVNEGGHDWFGSWGNMDIQSSAVMWSFWSEFCGNPLSDIETFDLTTFKHVELCSLRSNAILAHEDIHLTAFDTSGRLVAQRFLFANQIWEMKGCGAHLIVAKNTSGQIQQLRAFVAE